MKWARTRILAGFLAALVLVLAGAVYTRPQMRVRGLSGYTAEGAAEFNALAAEGDGCLLAGLYIGWYNEGPLSWTLPYTVRDIVVYGTDGLPLQQQPVRIVYDQEKSNVMPGAGFRESRETLLADYEGHGAELVELPASFSTSSPNLSALVLFEAPLPEDAGAWQVRLEYRLLGLIPRTETATLFSDFGGEGDR
ncbi:hypothetical protein [Dysosmobacter sp.]|uniref:hypothetical protein n=1 Tax=Dysosmobacter sp. TaxID=2591382 RepID=UPI00262A1E13|nr:hypothetical protein [Dysosmobacter sp.]